MSQLTENAIMDAFIRLLNDTPLDKITVRDIITECGISRNTFYYHYGDIYALLKATFQRDVFQSARVRQKGENWEDVLKHLIDVCAKNRRVIHHIYGSINHDLLTQYIYEVTEEIMLEWLRELTADLTIREDDLRLLCAADQAMFVGLLLEWIRKGMREEDAIDLWRTERFFQSILPDALRSLAERQAAEQVLTEK